MIVTSITANEYLALNEDEPLTIVDLRTPVEVATEFLPECLYLPVQELSPQRFEQLIIANNQAAKRVYLLCQSGMRADIAVNQLKGEIPHDLVVIEGGLNAIKAAGGDVEKGKGKVISLERQVRIAAGAFTVLGVVLGSAINPAWYGMSAFVGAGLIFAGITNTCGMALILAKMPWNQSRT